jgi:hypothetical protein
MLHEQVMVDYDKWKRMETQISKMYPVDLFPTRVSPFVPRTFKAYMAHRQEMISAAKLKLQGAIDGAKSNRSKPGEEKPRVKTMPAFNGKKFGSPDTRFQNPLNRGTVLAMETIWCPEPNVSWQARAPWPCSSEAKWEGDSRVATESGRFLRWHPLPRLPEGWPGWQQDYKENPMVDIYHFDEVWPVPTLEDMYLPVDEIEDPEIIASLVNKGLLDCIDALAAC